jgi:hypothetical protein
MSDNTSQEMRHYARYDAPLRRRALIHRAADEIERLRARVAELEFRLTPRRPTMPDPVVRPRLDEEAKP